MLPKNTFEIRNGGLYRQAVRCGKTSCRCARGQKHIAHYFITRRDGKLLKLHVPKSQVEAFKRLVEAAVLDRKALRSAKIESTKSLQEANRTLRLTDGHIRTLKRGGK